MTGRGIGVECAIATWMTAVASGRVLVSILLLNGRLSVGAWGMRRSDVTP